MIVHYACAQNVLTATKLHRAGRDGGSSEAKITDVFDPPFDQVHTEIGDDCLVYFSHGIDGSYFGLKPSLSHLEKRIGSAVLQLEYGDAILKGAWLIP